jgi:DMSO reductase anchor subunit
MKPNNKTTLTFLLIGFVIGFSLMMPILINSSLPLTAVIIIYAFIIGYSFFLLNEAWLQKTLREIDTSHQQKAEERQKIINERIKETK